MITLTREITPFYGLKDQQLLLGDTFIITSTLTFDNTLTTFKNH